MPQSSSFWPDLVTDSPAAALPEDAYLTQFGGAMAIEFALRKGLFDELLAGKKMPDTKGANILATLLNDAGALDGEDLSAEFVEILKSRRHIIENKLKFLRLAATDIVKNFDDLLGNLPEFMSDSETFKLFRYDRAMTTDAEALAATRPWVEYVSALSLAEAPALVPALPLDGVMNLLEVGGNSGVIARAILEAHPNLLMTVLDLPAVCAIGTENDPHARLEFHPGDARITPWPQVHGSQPQGVLFKSVLHDWPEDQAIGMLRRAADQLPSGGRIIVCERGPLGRQPMPFSMTANLVFAPFYRSSERYVEALQEMGFKDVQTASVELDMSFHIVYGHKP